MVREMLRHALATVAYRGSKAITGVPAEFAVFRAAATTRTPVEILAHVSDVLAWGLSMATGNQAWYESSPVQWESEVDRFFQGR